MADTQPEPIYKKTCGSCRQPATPLSCSLDYGFYEPTSKYFENYPLCICNPSSINSIEKFLQESPSMLQKTFYSKEFNADLSLLMYSVLKGYTDVVQILISAGANVNQSVPVYKTPIFQAVYLEDETIGRELISAGATIDLQNHEGHDLLEVALEKHHEYVIDGIIVDENNDYYLYLWMFNAINSNCCDAINRLIKKGVDVNHLFEAETTFLHEAVKKFSKPMVLSLVKKMKNIDTLDKNGHTALFLAVYNRQLFSVDVLINFPANSATLLDAFHFAVKMGDEDIVKRLLEKVTEVYGSDLALGKALYDAVLHGHENVVKILCATCNQDGINYIDSASGYPIISMAANHGKKEILEILCSQNGADLNTADRVGDSALLNATFNQRLSSAEILLRYGADPNLSRSTDKWTTPMAIACQNGDLDLVAVLVKYKAKVNDDPKTYLPLLCIAAEKGYDKIIELLLKHGAKKDTQYLEGLTALISAAKYGHTEVVRLLLDAGADHSLQKAGGHTALHLASWEGHVAVVKLLLENGADSSIQNGSRYTALDVARLKGHQEVVNLLMTKLYLLEIYI